MSKIALTVFQARAGDRNNLAIPGAKSIGSALERQLGVTSTVIGSPEPALNANWTVELEAAMPALRAMADRYESIMQEGLCALCASSRCAVSLATLPAVAKHRPDCCVVWFDAHADLNTPDTTTTGYLGGLALSGPAGMWSSGLGGGLSLANIILVGQRDIDPPEQALIDDGRVLHLPPSVDLPMALRRAIAGRPVYVHLDCDVLNPGIVPTDYVHENGLSLENLRAAFSAIADGEVVGLEIAEFQNAWTNDGEPVSPDALLDAMLPVVDRIGCLA